MTPEAGDILLADLGDEVRHLVLVLTSARFHRMADRALVAPAASPRPFPWRIETADATFAVDLLQSVPTDVLLEERGRATNEETRRAQRAVRLIR